MKTKLLAALVLATTVLAPSAESATATAISGLSRYAGAEGTCSVILAAAIDRTEGIAARVEILPMTTGTSGSVACQTLHKSATLPLNADIAPCVPGASASGAGADGSIAITIVSCDANNARGVVNVNVALADGSTVTGNGLFYAYA